MTFRLLLLLCLAAGAFSGGNPSAGSNPSDPVTLRFAVIGDTQGQHLFPSLIEALNQHHVSHLLIPGDLVDAGRAPDDRFGSWQSWIEQAQAFAPGLTRVLMAPGNHDLPSGGDARWRKTFATTPDGEPWLPDSPPFAGSTGLDQMDYCVDVGAVRFVSLTTDTEKFGPAKLAPRSRDWLFACLADAEDDPRLEHVFVFTHHPVTFDSGTTGIDGTGGAWWQGMLKASSKVRALFAGHWHLYQPSRPDPDHPRTWEVVCGTGGGGLEGRPVQNHHGWLQVDVLASGTIDATFYSDPNGAQDGWRFDQAMDRFRLHEADFSPARGGATRPSTLAFYAFEHGRVLVDGARSGSGAPLHGQVNGAAAAVPGVHGSALALHGGWAEAATIGDHRLAVVGSLGLDLYLRPESLGEEAVLLEYSDAGPHPPAESEAVNTCYSLRIAADQHLVMAWEHGRGEDITVRSARRAPLRPGAWSRVRVRRDAVQRKVFFEVDDLLLGDPVSYPANPSGGGAGFLHLGRAADGSAPFRGALDELQIMAGGLLPTESDPDAAVTGAPLWGDLDQDGVLDPTDLSRLAALVATEDPRADLDGDGRTAWPDLWLLMRALQGFTDPAPKSSPDALATGDFQLQRMGGEKETGPHEFRNNAGLRLAALPAERRADYRLSMLVSFEDFGNGKWGKLVDFKGRREDAGLYLRQIGEQAFLEFFPDRGRGATAVSRDRYHLIEVLRDGATKRVEVFLDGHAEFAFDDSEGLARAEEDLHLYCDDRGAESAAGQVCRLRLTAHDQLDPNDWPTDLASPVFMRLGDGRLGLVNRGPASLRLWAVRFTPVDTPVGTPRAATAAGVLEVALGTKRKVLLPATAQPWTVPSGGTLPLLRLPAGAAQSVEALVGSAEQARWRAYSLVERE